MNPPALRIEKLVKRYGTAEAVKGISFEITPGEFFGFLGPNGAGKSTTIHCITGIATPTSGTIEVYGVDVVKNYRAARSLVGFSPQEFNVDIFSSTEAILYYMAGFYGMRGVERQKRIDYLIEKFDLIPHRTKRFMQLSGGLKRRVMLARALIHDPKLLILDEPTAGVDVELRRELWKYLQELNGEGKTILLTSHYLEEVELLSRHIAIIHQGKIVAIDTKEAFIEDGSSLEKKYLDITSGSRANAAIQS